MENRPERHRKENADLEKKGIRLRAIVIGFILAMAICAITPFNNAYRQATPLGGGHFPLAPFFILVWMTLVVAFARKLMRGRSLLTGKELLVSWTLMVLVSGIAYTGLARTFFINLTAPYHLASVENRWTEVLHPVLPEAWSPQNQEAVKTLYNGFFEGSQMAWMEVLRQIPWNAWMRPLMVWGGFILLCYFVMLCIINILGRQALYNERMNFPLLQVPQMIEEAMDENALWGFFSNRFLLAGLSVPVFLHLINGLHFYYPEVPQIPTLILAGPYFPKHGIFSGFYKLKIYIYPAFIGFAFLTSKQISFSFWFFFLLGGLMFGVLGVLGYDIPAAALGVTFGPTLASPEETQMIGAYIVFFLFLLWLARQHFLDVLRQSIGLDKTAAGESEWLSNRFSFWGFVGGSLLLAYWLHFFGMPFYLSILLLGVCFLFMLVATRVICQGGIAYFTLTAAPLDGIFAFISPRSFSNAGILIAAVVQKVLFLDLRESLMPSLLHTRKITYGLVNRRIIVTGVMITIIGGVLVSFIAMLALCYKFGLRQLQLDWATRTTVAVYDNVFTLIESAAKPGPWVMTFSVVGAVMMLILVVCYHRVYWWPLHPIGYLTTYSSAMRILWVSFFIGWLFNSLCIRYGGVVLFKKLRYFFIGLIVGEFLMGGLWALIGLLSYASYQVLPT
jgi:Family of unknown function (DUF6785)/Domain of unknown function (DUF6784)